MSASEGKVADIGGKGGEGGIEDKRDKVGIGGKGDTRSIGAVKGIAASTGGGCYANSGGIGDTRLTNKQRA